MKLNKEKVDEILKKSHIVINEATGIDISPAQKAAAKREKNTKGRVSKYKK